ncbi:MAG: hypothetical protein ACRBCJ_08045 [Hyphomicrobiaceae bacterium]
MTVLLKTMALPFALLVSLALSGCGGGGLGDVAFEGKVFDALGVNTTSKREDANLAARAPLVMPPVTGALPKPGEGGVQSDQTLAGIRDPEVTKAAEKDRLARAQKEFCEKNYDPSQESVGQSFEDVIGPAGRCRKSILDSVSINSGLSF